MLDKLFGIGGKPETAPVAADEVPLAAAALMVEAALTDGNFDADERRIIRLMLTSRLDIAEADADGVISEAEARVSNASGHWSFAQTLKNRLSEEDRIGVLEMIWEVIYADGEVHHLESALVRRVAGLLYVRDQDSGAARRRVRARLGID